MCLHVDYCCRCCCCRPHSTNVLPAKSSTRVMWQPTVSPSRWQGKAPLCRDSSRGPGKKGRLVGICTQISGRRCDRASGRVGKVVRDVVDLQWKRDMRQGVVTCLCEVGLACGAFPWIGGAQQEKQMVFGLEGPPHTFFCWKDFLEFSIGCVCFLCDPSFH